MAAPPLITILGASLTNYARVDNITSALAELAPISIIPTPVPDKPYRSTFILHLLKSVGRAFTVKIPPSVRYVVILFPDNENVWTARLYRWLHRRRYKIVFDPFISIYDTYVFNKPLRALAYPLIGPALQWWLKWYESSLFNAADILLTDTDNHGRYLTKIVAVRQPWHTILIGANEEKFQPSHMHDDQFWREAPLRVVWYGKISLMHGVDYIWQALALLPPNLVTLTLIGDFSGFDHTHTKQWIQEKKLVYHAEKPPHYVGQDKIVECVKQSHVVLGMFGRTEKSTNVITNKEYEGLSAGRCLVTLTGQREFLHDKENCLMVDQHNPQDLVNALIKLNHDRPLLQRIAAQGQADYNRYASRDRIIESLRKVLTEVG